MWIGSFTLATSDADRASAYPTLKTKGISENYIKASGVDYTIFRTALVYGPSDHLTEGIRTLMQAIPFIFLLPGDGIKCNPTYLDRGSRWLYYQFAG